MPRQPQIIDFLRAQGLRVVEVSGWRTRGSDIFGPRGSVNHHTAGPRSGNHPSLNVLINGDTSRNLPGPLSQVSLARNLDVHLIAAGRANHAGAGSFRGLSGNSSMWGLEVEHTGVLATEGPPNDEKWDVMHRVHAAFALCSGFDAQTVCQHFEWAPNRKIDFIAAPVNEFRQAVQHYINRTETVVSNAAIKMFVRDPDGQVYLFNGETLRVSNDSVYRDVLIFLGLVITPPSGPPWFDWGWPQIRAVRNASPTTDVATANEIADAVIKKLPPGGVAGVTLKQIESTIKSLLERQHIKIN